MATQQRRTDHTASSRAPTPDASGHGELDASHVDQEIALRAYQLYEARGCQHGHDWDDWLEAENDVRHSLFRRD